MTPEKARELLDGRTPSPWWWCETDYPEVTVYHEKYGIIAKSVDIEEADLICTAPDLAAFVAGMRYEYAVKVGGSHWLRESDESRLVLTIDPARATRHYQQHIMEALAATAAVKFEQQCRVVRRLVTDEEVVS